MIFSARFFSSLNDSTREKIALLTAYFLSRLISRWLTQIAQNFFHLVAIDKCETINDCRRCYINFNVSLKRQSQKYVGRRTHRINIYHDLIVSSILSKYATFYKSLELKIVQSNSTIIRYFLSSYKNLRQTRYIYGN